MNVAQVALRFDAPGGVEMNVLEVTRRLRSSGASVSVYASDLYDESSWQRRSDYRPLVDGIPVLRFPVRKRMVPGLTLPMMVGLMDALSGSGADVIHAHSHRYGHVLQAAAVCDRRNIPLIVSTHYHPADPGEPGWKKALLRLQDVGFGATAYRVARALVVETEREAQLVREFAPADRIHVIPPGIDLSEWARPEGDVLPLGLPPEFFVYHGRLAPNKGLPTLVEALARLPVPARLPVVFLGPDWGMRAELERRAERLGVARLLVFPGWQEAPAVRAVIRHATALVLPSEWEAFGLVLLMAMAAGTPVVATTVGGVPEVLDQGRAGRLVPSRDAVALAGAMADVRADPEGTRDRVRHASERVRGLDWSVAAERHLALYREVAGA
ncbi:MAG TPA: glycosyltransferase [Thermoplasmata archaeon]|nr:glycosyltransferase [Thermoplasmata archaeon]